MSDLATLSVTEAADAFARGEASAEAMVAACLARIDAHDVKVNSVIRLDRDAALDRLLSTAEGQRLTEPNFIRFTTGARRKQWHRNCIAVGLSGLVTAIPLLMFAIAARRMDYSTLGFVQFIAPTVVFILGLTVFHEPLKPAQLWSFIFIWGAIAIFAWDLLRRRRALKTTSEA